ncbi:MAG: type II toxin-antitoxin system RelE/ParE family toxin [Candidatus Humimicrobiaceae bacterium]
MNYTVLWHEDALKDLKGIDKSDAQRIIKKVEKYFLKDPYNLGKPLAGHLKGFYRFQVDKYRIIYNIEEDKRIIFVLRIGKRDKIYHAIQ